LGRAPSSAAAASTRAARAGSTVVFPLRVRETVAVETPARAATSLIVATEPPVVLFPRDHGRPALTAPRSQNSVRENDCSPSFRSISDAALRLCEPQESAVVLVREHGGAARSRPVAVNAACWISEEPWLASVSSASR